MNKFKQYLSVAFIGLLLLACSGPKSIPLSTMEKIISEAMLSSAIADVSQLPDSVDCYLPILERYGYTMDDFRHTAYAMSTRKSNPLNEVFGRVAIGIDSVAKVAEYRYNMAMHYDTLVMNYYSDTLYLKDTTIRGSLAKYNIRLTDLKAGTYTVNFNYRSMPDYRIGTKALTYRTGKKGVKKIGVGTRLWLNRVSEETPFSAKINLNFVPDSLIISFSETPIPKQQIKDGLKDTSYISKISVVYMPEIRKARDDYYKKYFDSIKLYQIIKNEKDSLPIHFR